MTDAAQPDSAPRTEALGGDGRLSAPSAERNAQPLIEALRPILLERTGLALEIGSGTGQHVAAWSAAFPSLEWQPTDATDALFPSIRAWRSSLVGGRVRPPMIIDAGRRWDLAEALSVIISVNVIHIAPWQVARGIVAEAAKHLMPDGALLFYGPFREGGKHTGDGNARFDLSLRARNPDWGVRDLEALTALAADNGFAPPEVSHMPANNRLVCFRRA